MWFITLGIPYIPQRSPKAAEFLDDDETERELTEEEKEALCDPDIMGFCDADVPCSTCVHFRDDRLCSGYSPYLDDRACCSRNHHWAWEPKEEQ